MTDAHASDNKKKIIWFVVILVVVGGIIAACAVSANANSAPTSFISSSYTRDSSLDQGGNKAYTTTKSVSTVKSEITAKSKPVDTRTSSDGSVWMQYSDDIVALFPYNGGTKIIADDYDRMYSHYHSTYIFWWSSSRPGWGGGSGWRGGGSGSGK